MAQLFANNASTVLTLPVQDTDTVLPVSDTTSFPILTGSDFFTLTLVEMSGGVEAGWEIVKVTGLDASTVTVERGQEGTTPKAFAVNTKVELRLTADSVQELENFKDTHSHAALAPLASPAFTGTPSAPTAAAGTDTTQVATTAFVQAALGDVEAALIAINGV
jgi:hypothetical protein